jgi:hypothetical protein
LILLTRLPDASYTASRALEIAPPYLKKRNDVADGSIFAANASNAEIRATPMLY